MFVFADGFQCSCSDGVWEDPSTGLCDVQLCGATGTHFCRNGNQCNGDNACSCTAEFSGPNCEISKFTFFFMSIYYWS